ncbi:Formamidopyrimidine-DNA glycosylase [Spironucleus salmonicida]|uniref:Formamidopyrimidine-DNA glycosylase n=1 Tax=Spironucleus salmonicida TaxID=348837 RepID=V6LNE1_9EUKA|nr:Formamidopyrimidine-DNA glycosylase [Spironucleus salmonicida]|eukprot:EST46177.1 Formamidopyrimidine-DNA glycosylase [Spironucleus salmonicida]
MPEHPEVRQITNMINNNFSTVKFNAFQQKQISDKQQSLQINGEYYIHADQRGKQLKLNISFEPVQKLQQSNYFGTFTTQQTKNDFSIIIGFGLLGYFSIDSTPNLNALLSFQNKNMHLNLVSKNPQTVYYYLGDYNLARGPDPIFQQEDFKVLVLKTNFKDKNISDILMNQRYFNGVGNYLRSEIIHRANIHPFKAISYLDPEFINLVISILEEAFSFTSNAVLFNNWLKCYGKASNCIKDKNNRSIWTFRPIREKQTIQSSSNDIKDIQKFLTMMSIK